MEPRAWVARQDGLHAIKEHDLRASLEEYDGAMLERKGEDVEGLTALGAAWDRQSQCNKRVHNPRPRPGVIRGDVTPQTMDPTPRLMHKNP